MRESKVIHTYTNAPKKYITGGLDIVVKVQVVKLITQKRLSVLKSESPTVLGWTNNTLSGRSPRSCSKEHLFYNPIYYWRPPVIHLI